MDITDIKFNKYCTKSDFGSKYDYKYCEFIILNDIKELAKFRFEKIEKDYKNPNLISISSWGGAAWINNKSNIINFLIGQAEIGGIEFNISDPKGEYWTYITDSISTITKEDLSG